MAAPQAGQLKGAAVTCRAPVQRANMPVLCASVPWHCASAAHRISKHSTAAISACAFVLTQANTAKHCAVCIAQGMLVLSMLCQDCNQVTFARAPKAGKHPGGLKLPCKDVEESLLDGGPEARVARRCNSSLRCGGCTACGGRRGRVG